ncbi:MAG: MFS transporter [Chloroflexota bacterium]|jgi:MFS family permease
MIGFKQGSGKTLRWGRALIQRRISAGADHLLPQRWNWYGLVRPLDHSLVRQAHEPLQAGSLRSLRYFWLDGLFAAISENFYLGYVALFALAYNASNSQVGLLAAATNLLGMLALFPGAQLVDRTGRRKNVVIWSGGILSRVALLGLALIPTLIGQPAVAIMAIVVVNSLRSFFANLANPGWTALVADLVPETMRGRFFASRNMAMGLAALVVAPLAGQVILAANARLESLFAGYQAIFVLAFLFGMVSTVAFQQIQEPKPAEAAHPAHQRGDLRRALRRSTGFFGLVISALVWNMALQVAAPFFNVYLVSQFQATPLTIGILAGVATFTALIGQRVFGRLLDRKGAFWVQTLTGLLIPLAPLAWAFITAPWQVGLINVFSGFLWAGYNLSNFNLLLRLTPDEQRPRAVALFQTAVFGSAVVGPILGGFLADTIGFRYIFGISSAGRYVGTALFILLTIRPLWALKEKQ